MNAQPLQGIHVLVTRPRFASDKLAHELAKVGATAEVFPCIDLEPTTVDKARANNLLDASDVVIVTSVNALTPLDNTVLLPRAPRYFAIGAATFDALVTRGLEPLPYQEQARFTSESLLSHPELQSVAGKQVVIITGENSRALLADELCQRGATVQLLETYRRVCPSDPPVALIANWTVDVSVITSVETLVNCKALLGESGWRFFCQTPLCVISPTVADKARELGYDREIIVAGNASNTKLIAALVSWRENHERKPAG